MPLKHRFTIRLVPVFGLQMPILLFDQKISPWLKGIELALIVGSYLVSKFIINLGDLLSLAMALLLFVFTLLPTFKVEFENYPKIDEQKLRPTAFADFDVGIGPQQLFGGTILSSPILITLDANDDVETNELARWFRETIGGNVHDKSKALKLSIIMRSDKTSYYVFICQNEIKSKPTKKDGLLKKQIIHITTETGILVSVERGQALIDGFCELAPCADRIALWLGPLNKKKVDLLNVFELYDFNFYWANDLPEESREYKRLKREGILSSLTN